MSLGMFCSIPLPFYIWNEKYTAVMIACFPLVGIVIGTVWWLVAVLLSFLNLPMILTAAALTIVPFLVTGFIHLDGYMDTNDALLSRRPMEDRLRILVDPRVGAFAVAMLCVLFLLQFSAMYVVAEGGRYLVLLIAISVISRSCSVFSIFVMPNMPQCNYTPMLKESAGLSHKIFVVIVGVAAIVGSYLYAGFLGLIVSAAVVLGHTAAIVRAFKGFNGISGDLLGYAIAISELCGLIALAVLQDRGAL
jgi:adenosylcobinamide-GDP ribazoletransferase